MPASPGKVVVAMSGGVDSSVAAALLLRQGYDVVGAFMRLGTPPGVADACESGHKQGCCSVRDADDARHVAAVLNIPLYVLNFEEDFGQVIDYFAREYDAGRTPNPCIRCNQWLKFGKLAAYARGIGAEFIASGHYARVIDGQLQRGLDAGKDQSYVLFGLPRDLLKWLLLPIGEHHKTRVRQLAQEWNLPVFDKPDSQEICFVPDGDYAALLRRRDPHAFYEGDFVTATGEILGRHGGHQHFTIGQRKGLGIAAGQPLYVLDIDAAANRVTLGSREALHRRTLVARQLNLLSDGWGEKPLACQAQIRSAHTPQPAVAHLVGDALEVRFDHPQSAITPGQAVVIYDGAKVLGGGWIERVLD